MGVVSDFERKLLELKASINKSLQNSIATNQQVLVDQQTEGQFDKGKDANNISFIPSYAESTRRIKRSKGQPTNRVTLKDTGDLYNSIEIVANVANFEINAGVEYFTFLVGHYGSNTILGIQPEAMKEFIEEYTLPEIEKNFKQIIG
jgi:hypothetical protein